jgi:hypothetical protein
MLIIIVVVVKTSLVMWRLVSQRLSRSARPQIMHQLQGPGMDEWRDGWMDELVDEGMNGRPTSPSLMVNLGLVYYTQHTHAHTYMSLYIL